MNFTNFLNRLVDDGIEAVHQHYDHPHQVRTHNHEQKRAGSIAGFEACRLCRSTHIHQDLSELLDMARIATQAARDSDREKYWWYRCYEHEVEWVCNCVSVVLHNEGMPTIITPTARGVLKASEIVGLRAP